MPAKGSKIHRYNKLADGSKRCRRCKMKVTTKKGVTLYNGAPSDSVPPCSTK